MAVSLTSDRPLLFHSLAAVRLRVCPTSECQRCLLLVPVLYGRVNRGPAARQCECGEPPFLLPVWLLLLVAVRVSVSCLCLTHRILLFA